MRGRTAVGQVLALAAVALAHAQGVDPLHSPGCDAARTVLEGALDDAAHRVAGSQPRLVAAREQALQACLGRENRDRGRSGAPEPAIAVPAPVMQLPRTPKAPEIVESPVPAYTPPAVVTTCDASGCWDSSGRHIDRLGPMLVGPRGQCTLVGGTVHCP